MKKQNQITNSIFDPEQTDRLIKVYEGFIADHMRLLSEAEPNYETAKAMFEREKKIVEDLRNLLEKDKKTINALVAFRNNREPDKEFRIVRTTSHLSKPVKQRSYPTTKIPFQEHYLKALANLKPKRFITVDELYDIIHTMNYKLFPDTKEMRQKLKDIIYQAKLRHKVVDFMGKIGLPEWVENGRPIFESHQTFTNQN